MLLETLALGAGLFLGSKLNISNETVVGVGLLGAALAPLAGPATLLFGLGVGVTSIVSNIIKDKYKEKKEELIKENDINNINKDDVDTTDTTPLYTEEEIEEISIKAARDGFWCFTSTLCFNTIPLQLLGLIKGLGSLLLPVSIITLVVKGWLYITENPTRALVSIILTTIVASVAFFCLTNFNSGGVFTYFLALVSIPSIFINKNNKKNTTTKKSTKALSNNNIVRDPNSIWYGVEIPFANEDTLYGSSSINEQANSLDNLEDVMLINTRGTNSTRINNEQVLSMNNFLYGGSTNSSSIISTAIVLGQTVLWGSGKDVLGTIINGDASVLLDPYRFSILIALVGFLCLLGRSNYIESIIKKENNNNSNNYLSKLISLVLKLISVGYCMFTFSAPLVLILILLGLVINKLDNNNYVKNISIPLLLIVGIITSF